MVFRLPTHLESFIPPPSEQVTASRPWRGSLVVSGLRPSDRASSHELRVTAVETDGDNRMDVWPTQIFAVPTHDRPILRDVQAWVTRHTPPICTFMPDRLRNPNEHTVNQTNFRSFARILFESQMVAIATWNTDRIPGAGIVIYPAQNSSALLVGALFLSSPFPEFIMPSTGTLSPIPIQPRHPGYPASSSVAQPSQYGATSQRYSQDTSTSNIASSSRQPQYRYIAPRAMSPTYGASAGTGTSATWQAVKDEDDAAVFDPTLRDNQPDPRYPPQ